MVTRHDNEIADERGAGMHACMAQSVRACQHIEPPSVTSGRNARVHRTLIVYFDPVYCLDRATTTMQAGAF
jgi:hypothetical protein